MRKTGFDIVAIVASAGGFSAFKTILQKLPGDFSTPIVILQHLWPGLKSQLPYLLDCHATLKVQDAKHKLVMEPGRVYVNPAGMQMSILKQGVLKVMPNLAGPYRPSADVLLKSVAEIYKERAIAVVLTGFGNDGTEGSFHIKKQGGIVIAQNIDDCYAKEMPQNVIRQGHFNYMLPLNTIPSALTTLTMIEDVRSFFGLHDTSLAAI